MIERRQHGQRDGALAIVISIIMSITVGQDWPTRCNRADRIHHGVDRHGWIGIVSSVLWKCLRLIQRAPVTVFSLDSGSNWLALKSLRSKPEHSLLAVLFSLEANEPGILSGSRRIL